PPAAVPSAQAPAAQSAAATAPAPAPAPATAPAPTPPSAPTSTAAPAPVPSPAPAWPEAGGGAPVAEAPPAQNGLPGQRLGGMPVNPAPAPASWAPQPPAPTVPQAPVQPQPQPQQQAQPAAPAAQDPQPVVPWKPPVEDVFLSAARAQAAAKPAGLGRRLLARIVDGIVLGALVGAVSYPFVTAALQHIDEKIEAAKQTGVTVQVWLIDGTTSVQLGIVLAAFLVLGALYEALPTSRWGRTLGKKLCGIEVRDIEAHEPPAFGAALRRWLLYAVLGLLGIGLFNVIWCLFDRPWRQCWHDKAAGTFVAR
uniref:RDD family protein n=1 Tax=Streptomyces roseicoloratus TaxID=2508722 RepID=UPI001FEA8EFC